MTIIEKAPAKVNLGLDTTFLHSDGLNEWKMVMTSIDLSDYIEISTINHSAIEIQCDCGFLPEDHRNLAFRAAQLLKNEYQIQSGALIRIHKKIPITAGLGGGSTDAAAVLRGLNQLWHLNLNYQKLANLGLKVDSDVPYCVFGKTAVVLGKGDQIHLLPKLPSLWIVVAKPAVSVSTPKILKQINYDHLQHMQIDKLVKGIENHNLFEIYHYMGNVLEPVSTKFYPQIKNYEKKMLQYGADVAQMSGTGPTVFSMFRKRHQAQRVLNSLNGFCKKAYLVHSL
ncbi:4-diphosphocytidyl-2-C-methyl-D-erythritol kinase [Philodulcilactobacillus myokoensis]|uniref:4-diphosphocytidyl-2-C-methyl-D-erythritol kinase n=1 Tax=Philodulcilactobacillus myokoensis TaxID=2929573 RepID=A0A9W6ETU9_9LACO|nr:4-(cytidine 5'-diphospho)-2-C-methyl-D-erythritol kinase [Philodulcilactobacillus myokoensis]GLB47229.1 4-diphosphocytidyl-2-C-methyl-D-erythritol kinase [Philodulcilactobacillus myokoensis]